MIRPGIPILMLSVAAVLTAGCGGALRNGWDNFRAYYNAYYNAKEYFKEGEKAVRDQPVTLGPDHPVRVHPPPVPSGSEFFEQAIEKSGRILQHHRNSAWADDALLLMGKSHYYLQDYTAAVKRFEQLLDRDVDSSPSMRRQATIWKGRAMLDLGIYNQGIIYLEKALGDYPDDGPDSHKGELQILAGEHYALLENWEQASKLVSEGLGKLSDRKLRGAAFFLYGQLLERQGRLEEAYYAFGQVPSHFAGFEYDFWSRIKQAEVSREQGSPEVALAIYRRMQNNDKYADRRERLLFELARTLEMQGKFKESEGYYQTLLYGEQASESRTLKADIYYRLGSLQNVYYQDYALAAAYFDTSASLRKQPEEPSDRESAALAEAYRRYADLKQSIHRADSLLRLGSLPPEKLDALIERARAKKRRLLLERQEEASEDNRMMNQPAFPDEPDTSRRSAIYGFLNHRSQAMVDQAKAEFRIIWGERPLVDNWRRRAAINRANGQKEENGSGGLAAGEGVPPEEGPALNPVNVDAIPRNETERVQLKADRAADRYRLGNILFLELDQPDSARVYYHKVINGSPKPSPYPSLRPRAMYALHEIFRTTNRGDSLRYWGNRIRKEYPGSEYVQLIERGKNR